jgi:hypothetical protein
MHFERVFLLAGGVGVLAAVFALGASGCSSASGGGMTSGSGGGGGAAGSGGCLLAPHPNMFIDVRSTGDAPLPDDTSIIADWSGGEAGPWVLDDPKTWRPLEASDLVCDIDRANPPVSLKELHCQVWTTGPTRIRVDAFGFSPFDHTLVPSALPCAPPGHVVVELDKADGGS